MGRLRHALGLGPRQPSALFGALEIGRRAEAALDRPRCAILEHAPRLGRVERADGATGPDAGRDVALQL